MPLEQAPDARARKTQQQKEQQDVRSNTVYRLRYRRRGRMRVLQAFERFLRGLSFGTVRCERHDLLPRCRGAVEILLAERLDDAQVEQRLGVLGIDRQRMLELLDRAIRLVRVVVGHAQIGRDVGVLRLDASSAASYQRDRVGVALGVEVACCPAGCAAPDPSGSARRQSSAPGRGSDRAAARGVLALAPAAPPAAESPRAAPIERRLVACWLPRIQPTIRPNRLPAMAKTIDSDSASSMSVLASFPDPQNINVRRSQSTSARPGPGRRADRPVTVRARRCSSAARALHCPSTSSLMVRSA